MTKQKAWVITAPDKYYPGQTKEYALDNFKIKDPFGVESTLSDYIESLHSTVHELSIAMLKLNTIVRDDTKTNLLDDDKNIKGTE